MSINENGKLAVRKPAVAGTFYPAGRGALQKAATGYISAAAPPPKDAGRIIGVLVPHAGYVYSGAGAGAGFSAVKDLNFDTAVILGTAHHAAVRGAALCGCGAFETPLGLLEVDGALQGELLKSSELFSVLPRAHEEEHSVEVQLPFLQSLGKKDLRILPLVLNTGAMKALEEIGTALGGALKGKKALLVISSDLSHYPPAEIARRADTSFLYSLGVAARAGDFNYLALAEKLLLDMRLEGLDTVCCGFAALVAGAFAARALGADDFTLLEYSNSGGVKGADTLKTVGYGTGIFAAAAGKRGLFPLSALEKKELLSLARRSIAHYFEHKRPLEPELSEYPAFNSPAAAFVTLHKNGRLRGCIGSLEARRTLAACVAGMAAESAFGDARFPPLEQSEFGEIAIEISVLSPLLRVQSAQEIEQGRHGVLIRKGRAGGTYLPQVWEHFKKKEDFLNSLCEEKAGIPACSWKERDTELYCYTADVITE